MRQISPTSPRSFSIPSGSRVLTLQCSHLFFTELWTFIPRVCCIKPPPIVLVAELIQPLPLALKIDGIQLDAELKPPLARAPTDCRELISLAGSASVRRKEAITGGLLVVVGGLGSDNLAELKPFVEVSGGHVNPIYLNMIVPVTTDRFKDIHRNRNDVSYS